MDRPATDRIGFFALCAILVTAFVFGGGGSRQGLANLVVQLAALGVLALCGRAAWDFWRDAPLGLRALIVGTLLLPVVQIIPLPESLWTNLPGRELVVRSYEAAGTGGWMSWSVSPLRTMLALSALITPLAIVMAGWTIPHRKLVLIGWLVVALGIVTTLMGLVQLNPAGDNMTLFGAREPGNVLLGTFANRNSTALLLGFCLALACLLPSPRPHPAMLWVRCGLAALLMVAIILTKSRTGLVLAVIPLVLASLRAGAWMLQHRTVAPDLRRRTHPFVLALGGIAIGMTMLVGIGVAAPERVGETFARFAAKDDPRRFIWEDAVYSAGRYWPAGAGIGNFDEVFQIDESLENLTLRTAGRAHNDYLELAIEAGITGLLLAVLWIAACCVLAWHARRSSFAWTGWAGGTFLLAIALQSITDYPLRNQSILAFAGFALLLLARTAACHGTKRI